MLRKRTKIGVSGAEEPGRQRRKAGILGLIVLVVLLGLWVLNVSRPGSREEGCLEECANGGERRPGPLRVISLNMLHGFPRFRNLARRLDLIAREIRLHDADIVCLQEVPWTLHHRNAAEYLAERTRLNYVYLRANGNRWALLFEEGEAILSRFPMRQVAHVELAPSAGFFEHRVALRATVITPWGNLPVTVTHLTNGDPAVNQAQAASLVAFVAETGRGPALVAGDFNALSGGGAQEMTSAGAVLPPAVTDQWLDTYRVVSAGDGGFTCCVDDLNGGPEEPLEKRIDYVFLVPAPGARVAGSQPIFDRPFRVGGEWQWVSDHTGLLVTLEISGRSQGAMQR